MPLSEHEQRLLDQIERALYAEDPKFASTVRHTDLRRHMRRRLWRAVAVLVLGFGLMLTGMAGLRGTAQVVVSLSGFVVMLGALLLALSSWKRLGSGPSPAPAPTAGDFGDASPRTQKQARPRPARTSSAQGGWKGRLEERWKRRWDERGGGGR